jgi:hypothetical protein
MSKTNNNYLLQVCIENLRTNKWEWFTPCEHSFIEDVQTLVGNNNGQHDDYEMVDIEGKTSLYNAVRYKSFEDLKDVADYIYKKEIDLDILSAVIEEGYSDIWDAISTLENDTMFYSDCWSMEDVAREWFDQTGKPSKDTIESYIDENAIYRYLHDSGYYSEQSYEFIREVRNGEIDCAYGHEKEELEVMDDQELENIFYDSINEEDEVQNFIECLDEEYLFNNFFDYKAFGRDMEIEGSFIYMSKGEYIQIFK